MKRKFHLVNFNGYLLIVETATSKCVAQYSDRFADSARLDLKIRNGERVPKWDGDTLIFLPTKGVN